MATGRRYRIHEVIGRGGHGTVYRATHEGTGGFTKEVAIKMLSRSDAAERESSRLRDEARMLGLLRHRAILQVDDLVRLRGRWALVTEYVHGANLFQVARDTPIPTTVALEIAGEVAGALHAAWNAAGPDGRPLRLIHRDIKLSNIQLTAAGEVKVLDFGIARAELAIRETDTGRVLVGSPTYMSPERLDMIDAPAGDIYALAVVMCEAISRRRFHRTSPDPARHAEHVDVALARVRWSIGSALDPIEPLLRHMLTFEADARPSAREVERRCRELRASISGPCLAEWAEHVVPQVRRDPIPDDELVGTVLTEPIGPTETRGTALARRALRIGGALALALATVAFGVTWWSSAPTPGQSPRVGAVAPQRLVAESAPDVPGVSAPVPIREKVREKVRGEVREVSERARASAPEHIEVPRPASPTPTAGALVTAGQLAGWIARDPAWAPAAAIADGRAEATYLRGWAGLEPPDPTAAAVDVSWWAARAYCQAHGSDLAGLDQAPPAWSGSAGPFQEWRVRDGRPAWRRFDGATSTAVRRSDANAFTGFRCAR